MKSAIPAYVYPAVAHVRRHGPFGYLSYEHYREWLRDEFSFRCVYCLKREKWVGRTAVFHIDHLIPQSLDPARALCYENLIYVCAGCNLLKSNLIAPDPCETGFGNCLQVHENGEIEALNSVGETIIEILNLASEDATGFRRRIISVLQLMLEAGRNTEYRDWLSYPSDLVDLSKRRPAGGNKKPDGILQSCFARRSRGEQSETY